MENKDLVDEMSKDPLTTEQASVYIEALNLSIEQGFVSRSFFQRKLSIGYRFADSIFNWMERNGYIEFGEKDKFERKTLITRDKFESIMAKMNLQSSRTVISKKKKRRKGVSTKNKTSMDELYKKALKVVVDENSASISLLQRRLSIGYYLAGELIERMDEEGYIGPFNGATSRKVYITKEQNEQLVEDKNV